MLRRLESAGITAGTHYRGGRYRVSVEALPSRLAAETKRTTLEAAGFSELTIEEYRQDVTHPEGPWEIHVLEADPEAVRAQVVHAYDAAIGLETTSGLSRRRGALAAINGGYYLRTGILQGDALGVLQVEGRLLSEPDRGRAALGIFDRGGATHFLFGRLRFRGELVVGDGTRVKLDGINRRRGRKETILYTPEFHRTTLTPPGGAEVVVRDNRIVEIRRQAGSSVIPRSGFVVSLADSRAVEVLSRFRVGQNVTTDLSLLPSQTDRQESWKEASSIVGGGPLLLSGGRRIEEPKVESISRVFFLSRHPRTGVGVRADGTLLFVTVDGRQPRKSVGMSLAELTDLFVELGAVSAMNLDGGGSTAMVVHNRLVNSPSDPTGERQNADAILLFARARKPPS
jgi:exopolysaccharide biosynthesis protein